MAGQGRHDVVTVSLQNQPITTDFYLLTLGWCDTVLGAHWLRTLGPILWDISNLSMQFNIDGKRCKIHRDSALELGVLSESKLKKTIRSDKRGGLLQLFSIAGVQPQPEVDPQIQRLLDEFHDMFGEPQGLPSPRPQLHQIPLDDGTRPISVRPCMPFLALSEGRDRKNRARDALV